MKKIVFTLLVLVPFSLNAQWEIINEGYGGLDGGVLKSLDFISDSVGWQAGYYGLLFKTTDCGVNWFSVQINNDWCIDNIDFINESIGWAIGRNSQLNWDGYIWKTNDGGQSWSEQLSNVGIDASLYAIDENDVYYIGDNKVFKTTDGGNKWIEVSPPNTSDRYYNSLWFKDSQTGIVAGDLYDGISTRGIILKTTDGGISWNENIVSEFNSISDLQFLDSTVGYFKAKFDTSYFICKTVDMCSSWSAITQRSCQIDGFQFIDKNLVYAITDDNSEISSIIKSTDGGSNWTNVQTIPWGNGIWGYTKIFFKTKNVSFITRSGDFSSVLLKKDYETDTWEVHKLHLPLKEVFFPEKGRGIIIGIVSAWGGVHAPHQSIIFSTSDGGNKWDFRFSVPGILNKSIFINDSMGLAFNSINIFRTTNYGQNWEDLEYRFNPDSNAGFWINDISFINDNIGWAVGGCDQGEFGSAILNTQDCGSNWELEWRDSSGGDAEALNSIYFPGENGYAVGDNGRIILYAPQTGWVKKTSVTDLPLNKVFFADENYGWIAGGYQNQNGFQKIFLKTTNGGANWNTVVNIPYLFRDIAFIDNSTGWAIGYTQNEDGGILKTTDGGNTWEIDTGNLPAQLNALYIKDEYGWAVGDNGLILRTTNAGPVWVEDENDNVYPTEFVLEQNYPNPFNPTTKIKYALPKRSQVLLKVYDILGREIAALVNEEQTQGDYEVEFDATRYSSGIYFYQLRADNYLSTKKMILIK